MPCDCCSLSFNYLLSTRFYYRHCKYVQQQWDSPAAEYCTLADAETTAVLICGDLELMTFHTIMGSPLLSKGQRDTINKTIRQSVLLPEGSTNWYHLFISHNSCFHKETNTRSLVDKSSIKSSCEYD